MNRRARAVAGLAVLAAGAWGVSRGIEAIDDASWVRVERRDLVIGVEASGELQAVDSADLGPPALRSVWDFKISFMAPEGSEVAAGDPVLRFDVTRLQRQLQEKVAERDSAIKELEKRSTDFEIRRRDLMLELAEAEAQLRRAELKLAVPGQVAARRELEQARIDQRLAELRLGHARSSLENLDRRRGADLAALAGKRDQAASRVREIESHIAAMTVAAPRPGTVIYKTRRGDKRKVGDSVWRAEKVIQIPDLERMVGEGEVAEADAGRLAAGQRVTLRLDAYPDRQYSGKVSKIHRTVQPKSWRNPQKVVRLEIELDDTDVVRMRPGMRFRGEVEVERVAETLVVPQETVVSRPEGTAVVVRSLAGKREVFPTFGKRNADLFAVVSGLEEGDRVLLRGGGS